MGEFLFSGCDNLSMNSILLANTHPTTRSALTLMLRTRLQDTAILTTAHWDELLDMVEKHHPALVLLDGALPGCTVEKGLAFLHPICPDAKVIILGTHFSANDDDRISSFSCLEPPERLLEAVQLALA
jgi:DNA-binding NarL/FixJ family response regulator